MTELPDPVRVATVPDAFSPSLMAMAKGCALRSILTSTGADRLPTAPPAERGTVFHKLLERAAGAVIPSADDPWQALEAELDKLLDEARDRLAAQPQTKHFADLRKTLPQVEWYNTVQDVLATARRLLVWGVRSRSQPEGGVRPRREFRSLVGPGRWTEVRIEAPDLRIAGRIDILERDPAGTVVVYDHKTGRVLDRAGAVLDHIALQLRLYALAIRSVAPGTRTELVVCHGEREERLSADADSLAETQTWLEALLDGLPVGEALTASDLARPGADCRTCPHRHVCSSYQETVPRHWQGTPEEPPWPLDTWGKVLHVEQKGTMFAVDLEDVIGRRVRIHRLDSRHGALAALRKGQGIWFFGLCSTRSLIANGVRVHPLNFYELPSESTQPRAWSLAVFTKS